MRRLALLLLLGCGRDDLRDREAAPACDGWQTGDLAISEIMANPDGSGETGKEWFEIYNPGGEGRDLAGVSLVSRRRDGSREKKHVVRGLVVPAGGYAVVGGVLPEVAPAHVDYAFGDDLGSLSNSGGELLLRCGAVEIDRVAFAESDDGAAWALGGSELPDALGNDDETAWCNASRAWQGGNLATPGEENDACPGAAVTWCREDGVMRSTIAPRAGDVLINEILPNPAGIGDAEGEWVELAILRDVDLNGLTFGKSLDKPSGLLGGPCLRAGAGSFVVVQRLADPLLNGGLPAGPVVSLALGNSEGQLVVSAAGEVLDVATWSSSSDGASWSRDRDGGFCKLAAPTPGETNPRCPVPADRCEEPDGSRRALVSPAAGELVITEILADTLGAEDPGKEWFEVLVLADVDLNGLSLGKRPPSVSQRIDDGACRRVHSGQRLIFAGSALASENGGLPAVDVVKSFALAASGSGLWLGLGDQVIDAVTWASAEEAVAWQLDGEVLDALGNDDPASFCSAPEPAVYGDEGYRGTPGAANLVCP